MISWLSRADIEAVLCIDSIARRTVPAIFSYDAPVRARRLGLHHGATFQRFFVAVAHESASDIRHARTRFDARMARLLQLSRT